MSRSRVRFAGRRRRVLTTVAGALLVTGALAYASWAGLDRLWTLRPVAVTRPAAEAAP